MKNITFLSTLLATTFLAGNALAVIASGNNCGNNCSWSISDDGILTVTGEGRMYGGEFPPWYNWGSRINSVIVGEGITSTGKRAFEYTHATSIVLPTTAKDIGNYFCYGCQNLESITISDEAKYWGGRRFSTDHSLTIHCLGDPEKCKQNIESTSGDNGGAAQHAQAYLQSKGYCYQNSEGQKICGDDNGNPIISSDDNENSIITCSLAGKKIYTVQEAEDALKDCTKFHVGLTYK